MSIINFYKNFDVTNLYITRKQLLNLSIHLGHKKKNWLKIYNLYILGFRLGYIIFNLDYILYYLNRVILFLNELFYKYGRMFIISHLRNRGFIGLSYFFFKKLKYGGFYDGKYIGGLISNFFVLKEMKKKKKLKYHINFFGFKYFLPSVILILDSNEFYSCFLEALYLGIPSIGVIDSDLYNNCFYPIFGNNESFFFSIYLLIYIYFLKKKNIFLRKLKYYLFLIDMYVWIIIYNIYRICIKYEKYDFLCTLFKEYYNYIHECLDGDVQLNGIRYFRVETFKFLNKLLLLRLNIFRKLLKRIKCYKYYKYQRQLKYFFKKKVKFLNESTLKQYFINIDKTYKTFNNYQLKLNEYFEFGYNINKLYRWDFGIWKYNRLSDLSYKYYLNNEEDGETKKNNKKIEKRLKLSGFVRFHFRTKHYLTYYTLYLALISFVYGRQYLFILIYRILKRKFTMAVVKILSRSHRKITSILYFFRRYIFQFYNLYKVPIYGIDLMYVPSLKYNIINYGFSVWNFLDRYYLRLLLLNRSMAKQLVYKYRTYVRKHIRYIFKRKGVLYRAHFFYNKTLQNLYLNDFKLVINVLHKFLKKGKFNLIFMIWIRFKKFLISYKRSKNLILKKSYFYKYNRKKKKKLVYYFFLFMSKKRKLLLKLLKIYCFGWYTYNMNFRQFVNRFNKIKKKKTRLFVARLIWDARKKYVARLSVYLYNIIFKILVRRFNKIKYKKVNELIK